MLNRLSFELAERQRYATLVITRLHISIATLKHGPEKKGTHPAKGRSSQRE